MSVWLLCGIFTFVRAQTNYVNFWIPPELSYGDMAYISCKPNAAGETHFGVVTTVELYRQRKNQEMEMVVKATYDSLDTPANVEWFDSRLEARSKVTVSLGPPDASMLKLRLSDIDCSDAATYKCIIRDEAASGHEAEKSRTSTVIGDSEGVYPITTTYVSSAGDADVSQTAVFAALRDLQYTSNTLYPSGSVGLFKCRSSPGFPLPEIRWCIKRPGSTSFQSFNYVSVHQANPSNDSLQACLYTSSQVVLLPVRDEDNGTVLSCAVTDEECGSQSPVPPIATFNDSKAPLSLLQSAEQVLSLREIYIYVGESQTHIGVNAEENRASINRPSANQDSSTMVVLGIAIFVILTGIVLLTIAVVTYMKAKKTEAVGKLKSPGSQYTELEMPRRINAIHSGVYDAIDNLPPDLPSDGKPYAVDDMYVLPVD